MGTDSIPDSIIQLRWLFLCFPVLSLMSISSFSTFFFRRASLIPCNAQKPFLNTISVFDWSVIIQSSFLILKNIRKFFGHYYELELFVGYSIFQMFPEGVRMGYLQLPMHMTIHSYVGVANYISMTNLSRSLPYPTSSSQVCKNLKLTK